MRPGISSSTAKEARRYGICPCQYIPSQCRKRGGEGVAINSQSSAEINDDFAFGGRPLEKVSDSNVNDVKPEMVSAVDEG